eukprot:6060008-Prorocentrum_lima.AAC.1
MTAHGLNLKLSQAKLGMRLAMMTAQRLELETEPGHVGHAPGDDDSSGNQHEPEIDGEAAPGSWC